MNATRWWPALLTLGVSCLSAVRAEAQIELADLYVEDPRPLEAAVLSLIERYPITITYEDARYTHSSDIRDVTEQVRRGPSSNKVLVPSGGILQASYQISRDTGQPISAFDMIKAIVDAKNASPVGGRYDVYQSGDAFHILPSEVRDGTGTWVRQQSILDTPITFTSDELNGHALIEAVLKRVGEASGASILGLSGERFTNALFRYKGRVEARNEPAREVLMRVLHSISPRFTWLFNYDPSGRYYVFAIAMTAERPPVDTPLDVSGLPREGNPTPAGVPFGETR